MTAEQRLREMAIELPAAPVPAASYLSCVRTGNLVFVSGQGTGFNGKRIQGRVGADLSQEEGYAAARVCALNLLAQLRAFLGSLDCVKRVVNLRGYVNCAPDFTAQPYVINGASDLMEEVFGEAGRHSRTAIGAGSLPNNIAVEVELVVEVCPE